METGTIDGDIERDKLNGRIGGRAATQDCATVEYGAGRGGYGLLPHTLVTQSLGRESLT